VATVKLDPAKGVQIPNLTTTERNAISSPETGALIWNTTTSAINQYNGSAWSAVDNTKLPLAGGTMTGNLVLSTANSQVGIGTDNMQIFNSVGGSSGLVVTGVSSSTAILGNTLSNITIANGDGTADNTAALHFAREDTDGNPNYAGASVVSQFKETQVTGQYPKADLAFLTSTAANNAPSEKMRIDAAGNVVIGNQEGTSSSANQRLLINADAQGGIGHGLYIHNDSYNAGRARIALGPRYSFSYNTSPYIESLSESTSAAALIFGTTTGTTARETMRIDSAGIVTKPLQPAFLATKTSTSSNAAINTDHTVLFPTEVYDQNSDFSSNTFTAPVTGKYLLTASLRLDQVDEAANYYLLGIIGSNRSFREMWNPGGITDNDSYHTLQVSGLLDMDANDTAIVRFNQSAGNPQVDQDGNAEMSYFCGHLVC
jgi:hypothetical protein